MLFFFNNIWTGSFWDSVLEEPACLHLDTVWFGINIFEFRVPRIIAQAQLCSNQKCHNMKQKSDTVYYRYDWGTGAHPECFNRVGGRGESDPEVIQIYV